MLIKNPAINLVGVFYFIDIFIFNTKTNTMTKDQLKEMIKECLQEGASAENFVTFTISGGYHDYKTKPKDSTVTVTVGTALDILDLLRNQSNSDIKQLSFELSNHLPENHI